MVIKKYVIGAFSVNCYLLADEVSKTCAIIDAGDVCKELETEIAQNGYDVKYLIFTHGHFDHIGGAYHYAKKYGAKVLVHSSDAACLSDERANFTYPAPYDFVPYQADVLLEDGDIIEIGNIKLEVIHTPGHTRGGVTLYADGVAFSGDTLFYRSIGRTDFAGGSFDELSLSVKRLYTLPQNTVVYPGHGCHTTISDEMIKNPYVRL